MSTTRLMLYCRSKVGLPAGTSQRYQSYHKSRYSYQTSFMIKHYGLLPLGIGQQKTQKKINTKKISCINSVESGASSSPGASSNSWYIEKLDAGNVIVSSAIILEAQMGTLTSNKKNILADVGDVEKVDTVVESVECVVEVVEKVAEEVEKVADEVADALPENGKLKEAVCLIETVAKETAKDARIAEELIQKVEDVEKEVMESLIEPVKHQEDKLTEDHASKGE